MAKDPAPALAAQAELAPRSPRPLWQVAVFLLGAAALIAVPFVRSFWQDNPERQLDRKLEAVRGALASRPGPPASTLALAEQALALGERLDLRLGEAKFLFGSLCLRLAPEEEESVKKARQFLEQAEQLGVPECDQAKLKYRQAIAWARTGAEPDRVLERLLGSLAAMDDPHEAYGLLTQSYLRLPKPNLDAALAANQKHLQLPTSNESLLAAPRLLRGELLLRLKQPVEARKVLTRVGDSAPADMLTRARLLMAQSYQDEQAWTEAARLWEQLLADPRQPPKEPGRILHSLGICRFQLEQWAEAERAWEATLAHGGDEAQAAAVRLAELRLDGTRRSTALELFDRALRNVSQPTEWQNRLLALDDVRKRLETACKSLREVGEYEAAQRLVKLHGRTAPAAATQILAAEVAETWSASLAAEARKAPSSDAARQLQEAARTRSLEAATAFAVVAEARTGQADQADWLSRSGSAFLLAQDYPRAIAVLERFVKLLAPPERLGEAWLQLATAYRALNNEAASDLAYKQCIQYPSSAAFRARLQLALFDEAKGNFASAETILRQNLDLLRLAKDAETEERSLYALAKLLHRRAKHYPAVEFFGRALKEYPANAEALAARSLLARSCSDLALEEDKNLWNSPKQLAETQAHHRQQKQRWLEQALGHYRQVEEALTGRAHDPKLPEDDRLLLARARIGIAESHFHLGQYAEAGQVYRNLAQQYAGHYEALPALRNLFVCWSQLGNIDKMTETLLLANLELNRLPQDVFAGRPDHELRPAWDRWLQLSTENLHNLNR